MTAPRLALYLSHPEVVQDATLPVTQWRLSPEGRARLRAPWAGWIAAIFCSPEVKALQTAAALRPDLTPIIDPDLAENHRPHYLPPPAFEAAADAFFADPDRSHDGWEPARAAQSRILAAFLRHASTPGPILFTGHGAVGTLLHQALSGHPISRTGDQPPGGGNLYAIDLATMRPLSSWTPLELWRWPAAAENPAEPQLHSSPFTLTQILHGGAGV